MTIITLYSIPLLFYAQTYFEQEKHFALRTELVSFYLLIHFLMSVEQTKK